MDAKTRADAKAANIYETAWTVGFLRAKRDLKRNGFFRNQYEVNSAEWRGYEACAEAVRTAQQQESAA